MGPPSSSVFDGARYPASQGPVKGGPSGRPPKLQESGRERLGNRVIRTSQAAGGRAPVCAHACAMQFCVVGGCRPHTPSGGRRCSSGLWVGVAHTHPLGGADAVLGCSLKAGATGANPRGATGAPTSGHLPFAHYFLSDGVCDGFSCVFPWVRWLAVVPLWGPSDAVRAPSE